MSGSLSSGNCVCTTGRRKRTTTLPTTKTIIFGNSQGRRELSLVTRVQRAGHVQCCVSAMERTTKQIPHTWRRYCNDNEPMTRSYWQIIKRRHKRSQLGEVGDTIESITTIQRSSNLTSWFGCWNTTLNKCGTPPTSQTCLHVTFGYFPDLRLLMGSRIITTKMFPSKKIPVRAVLRFRIVELWRELGFGKNM